VQILGAAGCAAENTVQRFVRDTKVMQLIEGSRDIAELHLGDRLLAGAARDAE
jgi:acyl-CoA dehydrogenase